MRCNREMQGIKAIYKDRVYKCISLDICFDERRYYTDGEGNKVDKDGNKIGKVDNIRKPDKLYLVAIDNDNEIITIEDNASEFKFIEK